VKRRIGILLTCVDPSEFAKRFPDDGEKFRRLLQPLRPDWEFVTVPVKDGVFPASPEEFDGYVITGSPVSVNDGLPWISELFSFIRALEAKRIPTFGACFGHQAVAKALGGRVEKSPIGWGLGAAETIYAEAAEWMRPMQEKITLYAAHQDQVTSLPKNAVLLGGSAFCPFESFRIGLHVFTTQYHPEMTPDFVDGLLVELESDLGEDAIRCARESAKSGAEGAAFARWIVNFLDRREA
jgi:GMP synthase-like glutamine amidotransferase